MPQTITLSAAFFIDYFAYAIFSTSSKYSTKIRRDAFLQVVGQLFKIFAIVGGENQFEHLNATARYRFFAHTANGQNFTGEGQFSGHTKPLIGLPLPANTAPRPIVIPAEGPSLGVAPAGTCRWTK